MTTAAPLHGPDPATDLYDVKRLAQLLGIKPATIRTLRSRGKLPAPTSNDINGGAVWASEIIESFMEKQDGYESGVSPNPDLPQVVDLFAGCGGMSLGFQLAHFDVIAGYDNWKCAVDTYSRNLGHDSEMLDLSDVEATISRLERHRLPDGSFPSIIGGPPCQDFSSAGNRVEGARADLTEKYAGVIKHFMPPFFIMENVARAEKADAYNRALKTMQDAGYTVVKKVLNAAFCGVPQSRKRLIAFGSLVPEQASRVLEFWENEAADRPMTVRDWFGDKLGIHGYYRHPRSYARRGVFSIDEPSPTIRGVNRPIPAGYPGHAGDAVDVKDVRPLTTAERAQIQTFPEGFVFVGSKTDTEQMIGNAVPVRLGKFIACSVAHAIVPAGG